MLKKAAPSGVDREEQGDVIDVFLTPPGGSMPNAGVKFYFIHITGFPDMDAAKAKRIRDKLTAFDHVGRGTFDPKTGLEDTDLRNSRVWHVPRGALPASIRNQLRNNGEVTVTWDQAKSRIRRKLVKILRDDSTNGDAYDPVQSTEITDPDIADG